MKTLTVRQLSAELEEKSKLELNEKPEKIIDDLEALRSWLTKQPHINARQDDQFLIVFLRVCKYSLERAKAMIDMYYTVRTAIPEIFQFRDITSKQLQEILKLQLILPLLTVDDKTGARIVLIKVGVYDPNKISLFDVMKVGSMIADMLLYDDDTFVVSGSVAVVDLQGVTFGHIAQMTPSLMKKTTALLKAVYPIRLKNIHYINTLPICAAILRIVISCLSSKVKERVFLHDSFEALHKHINKELLPTEYGGSAGSIKNIADDLMDKLMRRRDWFIEDDKYKTDESKRPGTPKTAENVFGTDGSFRKFDID